MATHTFTQDPVSVNTSYPSSGECLKGRAWGRGGEGVRGGPQFDTDFGTKNAEYFDVYAGPISTRYGEVFWQGLPAVPLPDAIVKRFANKTIAIVGYEMDQVIKAGANNNNTEDISVPINYQGLSTCTRNFRCIASSCDRRRHTTFPSLKLS